MYLCYMDESGDTGVGARSPTPTYTVAAVLVHETHWVRFRDRAWRYAFQRIERTMNAHNERVMLMPDGGQYLWIRKLAREMRRFSMPGSMRGTGALERPMLKVLIDDPVERDSRESYFIQLADLNAYAAYRNAVPDTAFPQSMWTELGPAVLRVVNMYSGGTPGIVRA